MVYLAAMFLSDTGTLPGPASPCGLTCIALLPYWIIVRYGGVNGKESDRLEAGELLERNVGQAWVLLILSG